MNDLERTAREASEPWVSKTLEAFRQEAEKEINGTAYHAIRPSTDGKLGPRIMLAICVTGDHELSSVEKWFDFNDGGVTGDWQSYSLASMLVDADRTDGMGFQDLKDASGKRIAIALIASRPDKVQLLSRIFHLPP